MADEVKVIREILDAPEKHLTQKVRQLADELRVIQKVDEERSPALDDATAEVRALRKQASLLKVPLREAEHGLTPEDRQRLTVERENVANSQAALADVEAQLKQAPDRLYGRSDLEMEANRLRMAIRQSEGAVRDLELRDRTGMGSTEAALRQRIAQNEARLRKMTPGSEVYERVAAHTDRLYDDLDKITLGGADVEKAASVLRRAGRDEDADVLILSAQRIRSGNVPDEMINAAAQRFAAVAKEQSRTNFAHGQAVHSGRAAQAFRNMAKKMEEAPKREADPKDLEADATFAERVRKAAEEAGLSDPAYWMSTVERKGGAGLKATGRGLRATERNKRYTGRAFELGVEQGSPDIFVQGWERTVKQHFQWALVARNMETHAFTWSRGPNGTGHDVAGDQGAHDARGDRPR